jgi:hypothetical protein
MEHSSIILTLEEIQIQLRHLHWQTKSYAQHKAYGSVYEDLDEHIDMFAEVCMGKHGRPDFTGGYQLSGKDISEIDVENFLDNVCEFFISLSEVYDPKTDSDLLNIRDEMLGLFNKLKYLLTLG